MSSFEEVIENSCRDLHNLHLNNNNEIELKLNCSNNQTIIGFDAINVGLSNTGSNSKRKLWNAMDNLPQESKNQGYSVFPIISNIRKNSTCAKANSRKLGDLTISFDDGLRVITLDRPKKKNAITQEMYRDLPLALKEAAEDDNTVITVLTGRGDYYTSGNDLSTFAKFTDSDINEAAYKGSILLRDFISAFIEFPKILVAVVNGPAIGIGVTTLGLCDTVYATDKATFQTPFTALGQSAEGCSTYTFPRIMGTSKASELLYFNRTITAHEAKDWGLVSKVFPDASFNKEVFTQLRRLARLPVKSMIYTKAIVRQWDLEDLRRSNEAECKRLRERWVSEDCINAVVAFLSKHSKL